MSHQYLIAIDVGTSSCKTGLWTVDGQLVAEATQNYSLHRPDPVSAEIDAEVWWQAVCSTVHQVLGTGGIDLHTIAGIGVDGIGWTLVSVDENGNSLHPALIWLDRRAEAETAWLRAAADVRSLIDLCANPIDPAYITPKLLWLQAKHPDLFDRTHKFLTCSGFIVAQLTGEFTCDYTQAYGYHFFDIRNECWDADIANRLGIPLDKLPRLAHCTDVAGKLTPRAGEQLGLPAGIPVITGCLDAAVGALGAGVTHVGQTNEQGGQAGGMAISLGHVVVEPQLIFSHHVLPGQFLLQGGTVGGGSLGWFRDTFGPDNPDANPFKLYSQEAAETPPGSHGIIFIPYMAGERTPLWETNARGVFFGLSYATTRGDLLRAIMEGCAFAVYHNIYVAAQRGVNPAEYLGSGGATASPVWCQIKADVYNRPFKVMRRADGGEGGHLLGLYALTAQATGHCDEAGERVEKLLSNHTVYEPSPERHALYQDLFDIYLDLSNKMLSEFDQLSQVLAKHYP